MDYETLQERIAGEMKSTIERLMDMLNGKIAKGHYTRDDLQRGR